MNGWMMSALLAHNVIYTKEMLMNTWQCTHIHSYVNIHFILQGKIKCWYKNKFLFFFFLNVGRRIHTSLLEFSVFNNRHRKLDRSLPKPSNKQTFLVETHIKTSQSHISCTQWISLDDFGTISWSENCWLLFFAYWYRIYYPNPDVFLCLTSFYQNRGSSISHIGNGTCGKEMLWIVADTWCIDQSLPMFHVRDCALSVICLLGDFFGQIKPLFALTHLVTVLLPMSEMELRLFW